MRQEYVFIIRAVYIKTANDLSEIVKDDAANKKWKDSYKIFKENIRNHLKLQQYGRCAFCRCVISVGTGYANLEHLISKADYPQFKTLPENLVYCCWQCNSSKIKRNTINNPVASKASQEFPISSIGFIIINPYLDKYEDHIDFFDDIIISAKPGSVKGANTIEFYKLARPELAEERAREFRLDPGQVNHKLLQLLTNSTTSPNILEQVKNIIAQFPNWTVGTTPASNTSDLSSF